MFCHVSLRRYGVPYSMPLSGDPSLDLRDLVFLSPDSILLREEVVSLILSLGLVLIGSEEDLVFQKAMAHSEFSGYHFCDMWKDSVKREIAYQRSLCKEIYLRNRPRSRYVRSSAKNHSSHH